MKFEKTKILGFSFAFYGKSNIKEFLVNDQGGLENSHKRILGESTFNTILSFNTSTIENQRNILKDEE